jgi:SAM-dependent methyltransferase
MALPGTYFDDMYRDDDDPWGYRHRWYERRKQQLTLAVLPRERYGRAFEPACSNGELTALLAERCDMLFACDLSGRAVQLAQARCASLPNVVVEQRVLPHEWPNPFAPDTQSPDLRFDLIVIGELAYYLDPAETALVAERAYASLAAGGTLVACHWRHAFVERRQSADAAHAVFECYAGLERLVHHEEADLLLVVWSTHGWSVAQQEGLA